jgi:hypothetical protein
MFKESFNPNQATEKIEKKESVLKNQENMIALFRRLQNVYETRPEMKDFVGAMAGSKFAEEYTPERVNSDLQYVETTRDKIDAYNREKGQEQLDTFEENFAFAEATQAIITDRINSWMPEFKTIMTSDYDDLRVGIDMVMKHQDGGYLGTAFDATVSSHPEKINGKLEKNWDNNTVKGNIPTVKYFQDPDTKEKGRILVPKFIIGVSANEINQLAEAYLNQTESSFDSHPMRMAILDQIKLQISGALTFYEDSSDPKHYFAKQQYLKLERTIDDAITQLSKSEAVNRLEYHEYRKENLTINLIEDFFNKKQ